MGLRAGVGEVVHQGRDRPGVGRLVDAALPRGSSSYAGIVVSFDASGRPE
jgi:hypothetical protein